MNEIVINNFSVKRGSFTLSPISLTIQKGEIFAILGRTGSGKTVLLEAISGMFPGRKAKSVNQFAKHAKNAELMME